MPLQARVFIIIIHVFFSLQITPQSGLDKAMVARFEVHLAVLLKIHVFWDVVNGCSPIGGSYFLHLQCQLVKVKCFDREGIYPSKNYNIPKRANHKI